MKTENINIPVMTVSDVKNLLLEVYGSAIKKGISFKKYPTPFYWGPPGVGKSESVYQFADEFSAMTGKKVNVHDVRLLLFSPVDLRGVPVADKNREFTNWLKPQIFNMEEGEEVVNILFLDELSAAPQSVESAAYQICLDRKVGEHKLPENCIVIAAGNRVTDQSVSYKMPKALCNRLIHFNIECDYMSWRKWAVENGISEKVISYLAFDSSRLCTEPGSSELAYPTPRSWSFVSNYLNTVNDNPQKIHNLIAGCIGEGNAIEFEAYCKGIGTIPDINEILLGRCCEYPKSHDTLYALISGLVSTLYNKEGSVSDEEMENVFRYVLRFPKDFIELFVTDLKNVKGINKKLITCKSFQSWLNSIRKG